MEYSLQSIIAIAIALPLLALVAVFLRLLVRTKIQPTRLGIDDWLALAAGILAAADGAILATGVILGTTGRVYTVIPDDRYIAQGKLDYSTLIVEKALYGATKLSVLFFFRRIFLVQTRFKQFSEVMIVLISTWTLAYILSYAFSCGIHFSIWWTPGDPRTPPKCVDVNILNLTFAVTDVAFDIAVVATPYHWIRKVQMRKREKIGVTAIFLLGALSTIAAVIRLYFIAQGFAVGFGNGGNNHGSGVAPDVWSTVEGSVSVIAACLPPLGPIIRMAPSPRRVSESIAGLFSSRKDSVNFVVMSEPVSQSKVPGQSPHFKAPDWNRGPSGQRPSLTGPGPMTRTSIESFV